MTDPFLPADPAAPPPPAVRLAGITKTYGPVKALQSADLVLEPGSIHGLVGQNGAGKSTIIKILAGLERADSGSVTVFGQEVAQPSPEAMEALGIQFIHQDRLLVPHATVAEAIFLGQERRFGPFLRLRAMRAEAQALIRRHFGLEIDASRLVRELSAAEQKVVQITRAMVGEARVLVLDEPTAALVRREVDSLFAVLRGLRDKGFSILIITHHMDELAELCDRVTVFRDGQSVASLAMAETDPREIVALMVNRQVGDLFPRRSHAPGEVLLQLRHLTHRSAFADVSFDLRAGEVVGLSGLLGSGAKEILQSLFGLEPPVAGEVRLAGSPYAPRSPAQAVAAGVVLVPEDRRRQGVSVSHSLRENIALANLPALSRLGFVGQRAERAVADQRIKDLGIRTPGREQPVSLLSGGNQQKVVLGKWLSRQARVYLLDEPTVAVDVGAKVEIYALLNRLAAEGAAVLVLSSDLIEIAGFCDRAMIVHRGRLIEGFAGPSLTPDRLLAAATGASPALKGAA